MNVRARTVASEVFAIHEVDSPSVVLASMRAAELDGGADKLATAKGYVNKIIDAAVAMNYCTPDKAAAVKGLLSTGMDSFEAICELFIDVSKNPEFIQVEQQVASCCAQLKRRSHA